ncbi:hypothetical protein BGZ73_005840 [Actinomortierella ambigua]|nr:hypothetical protein BGZ73_005840 [Actinomortierella ambigua]
MPMYFPDQHHSAGEELSSEATVTTRSGGRTSATTTIATSFDPFGFARTHPSVSVHRRRGSTSSDKSDSLTSAPSSSGPHSTSNIAAILPPTSSTTTPTVVSPPMTPPSSSSHYRRHAGLNPHTPRQTSSMALTGSFPSLIGATSSPSTAAAAVAAATSGDATDSSSSPLSSAVTLPPPSSSPAEFEIRIIGNRTTDIAASAAAMLLDQRDDNSMNARVNSKPLRPASLMKTVAQSLGQHDEEDNNKRERSLWSKPKTAMLPPPPVCEPQSGAATTTAPVANRPAARNRLRSLDILRGITIFLMVMVNTQGAEPFRELAHTEWFGFTLADWVFPNFIFMVGMAIAIVFSPSRLAAMKTEEIARWKQRQQHQRRRRRRCEDRDDHPQHASEESLQSPSTSSRDHRFSHLRNRLWTTWKQRTTRTKMTLKVIQRTTLLFLIGCGLNAFELIGVPPSEGDHWLRIPGILQRIAFCYCILALAVLWLPHGVVRVGLPCTMAAIWFGITYGLTNFPIVPAPISTCEMVNITIHSGEDDSDETVYRLKRGQLEPPECTAQAYMDTLLFARNKDYSFPEFDAEGSVGSFNAVLTCWLGWLMGLAVLAHLQRDKEQTANTRRSETQRREREEALHDALFVRSPRCCPSSSTTTTAATAVTSTIDPSIKSSHIASPVVVPASGSNSHSNSKLCGSGMSSDKDMLLKRRPASGATSSSPTPLLLSSTLLPTLPRAPTPKSQWESALARHLEAQSQTRLLASLGKWFCAGVCVTMASIVLGWVIPISKPLWTPSYVLLTGGISISALCVLMYTYDIRPSQVLPRDEEGDDDNKGQQEAAALAQQQQQQQQKQLPPRPLDAPLDGVTVTTSPTAKSSDGDDREDGDYHDYHDQHDHEEQEEEPRRSCWRWVACSQRCVATLYAGVVQLGNAGLSLYTTVVDFAGQGVRWLIHVPLGHLFVVYGRNSTLIYILSEVVASTLEHIKVPPGAGGVYEWVENAWAYLYFNSFYRFLPPAWASVVFSLVYILVFFPLLWILDRRGLYLRL